MYIIIYQIMYLNFENIIMQTKTFILDKIHHN